MFCTNCGKEISENEVCPCKTANDEAGQTAGGGSEGLPQSQAVMANAAKIAADLQKNPYVNEIITAAKGIFSNNVIDTVADAGKRTDIMWMILVPISALISTASIFFGLFNYILKTANSLASGMWFISGRIKLSDILSGGVIFKMNLSIFLSLVASFFIFAGLLYLLMIVCKKKTSFYSVCNMLAYALLPATALMLMAYIFTLFLPAMSLILMIAAFTAMLVLIYIGFLRLGDFEKPPVWHFCAYYTLALSVSAYVMSRFVFGAMTDFSGFGLDRLLYELF
ncbi:MAG: hypothetical protein FWG91_04500 [Lachnospiraceae bacterium]|nr:hypothetical protein [Lachnospiraceae bacterium]